MLKKQIIIVLFMNVITIISYSQNPDLDLLHK